MEPISDVINNNYQYNNIRVMQNYAEIIIS